MHSQHHDIFNAVYKRRSDFFKGLQAILSINSVKGIPTATAPFGVGPKEAILKTLALAENMGFETKLVNKAMGYAQWGTDNEHYVGVIGHLDVVPPGTGWDYPPFDLTEQDGILYGRGILDNKGPILSNLYALSVLKELGLKNKQTIRIIFGSDEESGSGDIPMYLSSEKAPLYGYTPDCKYPAVYGERGVISIDITTTLTDQSLHQISLFSGTFDRSSVPDSLSVKLKNNQIFSILGKRSPSNAPEIGENVITLFAEKTRFENLLTGDIQHYFTWIAQSFHHKHHGEGIGINFSDVDSGVLQLTPYDLTFNDDTARLSLSIRYPISVTKQEVIAGIMPHLFRNSTITITKSMPSTVFNKAHPMIDIMTNIYEDITGLDGTPVTTTGATYARSMPNIIAFGPSFPGQKGIAHNKNEFMTVDDLMKNMVIYAQTLAVLVCED